MSINNQILGLPEEVFELILQHLELRDILSCNCVCVSWRNAVNSNRLWGALCRKIIPQERLKEKVHSRKMPMQMVVQDDNNLQELCPWRKRFIDDVCLKRNWKTGSLQEDVIGDISIAMGDLETDYELLLAPSLSIPSFEVYSLIDSPVMTDREYFALQQPIPEFFKLCDNILVVVQCTLLQVFIKDDHNLTLKFVGLFDKDHQYSKSIPDVRHLSDWYYREVGWYPCDIYVRCDHNGKYFVGMYNSYMEFSECKLHIWDLETLTKIQEVNLPKVNGRILDVMFSLRKNIVHVILELKNDSQQAINVIHSYDISKSSYHTNELIVKYVIPILIFTDTMAIMTDKSGKKVFFFNLEDGRLLDTQETNNQVDYRTLQLFGNLLTYAQLVSPTARIYHRSQLQCQVTVYDLKKMLPKDDVQIDNCTSIRSLYIVMDDLMLISTSIRILIRDVKNGVTLQTTLPYIDFLPPNTSCTKMIAQNPKGELVLLHLW